ncbi:copper resistance system multicopper oxidase, partial [Pseudomonas syringae]
MPTRTSRRTFVKGLAASGVLGGLGLWRSPAWALPNPGQPDELSGTEFDLTIGETKVNITGSARTAKTINGGVLGPLLRWKEGDTVTLRVKNRLDETTSIHWHGIILPANMDGVPGLSFDGIAPDGLYVYRFKVKQNGTYWYHSHSGFQEQSGVYGPLVIDAKEPEPFGYEREHVVMLSDWTDEDPARVMKKLKKQSDYYNNNQRTVGDFINDVSEKGWSATTSERTMWAQMGMDPTDLADVSGATYTYLMNGQAPNMNWTGLFKPGERIRLRLINGSSMTYFDVRIPGLKMTVVASDGLHVRPVVVDELRIAVAETFDVIVEPADGAYTLFAQSMDRTGYARGTLTSKPGLQAVIPPLDPRPLLSMEDIGMAAMDHGNMSHDSMPGMDHSKMPMQTMPAMQSHPESENNNPLVDMQAMSTSPKLNDPGIGLRDNGRRVLTYADLRSTFQDPDGREPGRTIELH